MDISEFKNNLYEEIQIAAEANTNDVTSEFIAYYSNVLIDAEELNDYCESYFEAVGKGNRKMQIDGFQFDEVDKSCVVIISDFSSSIDMGTITSTQIDKLYGRVETFIIHSIDGFIENNCEESSAGYGLSLRIREEIQEISKFRVFIYSDQLLSKRVKSLKKKSIQGVPVELNVWDTSRIYELESSKYGKETIEIDFEKFGIKGLPSVKGVDSVEEGYRAFLMTIPGNILSELYLEHGSRLLEGNVRSFLSARGKVNKRIRETIIKKPELFFAYNNGIAATSTEIECEESDFGTIIKKIKNLQIINGGQTTASIANAALNKEGDVAKVYVPMKLSVLNKEIADVMIPEISRSANSQNTVSDADFMSNHPFHIRMEEFSRKILAPTVNGNQYQTVWFYERARGQYVQAQMKLTPSEKKIFSLKNPKNQIIKKVDLAKYINTMNLNPHIVSRGAQANARFFDLEMRKLWDKSDIEFNKLYYKRMIAMAILFRATERIISSQDWYIAIKSYRANIVTYSIALILNEISKIKDRMLDYNKIWNSQSIPKSMEEQIVITTYELYNFITRKDRLTLNVTEWCKKDICWQRAKLNSWTKVDNFNDFLTELSELKDEYEDEKEKQALLNEISCEMEIIKKGSIYWKNMYDWAIARKIISPIERDILDVAVKIDISGRIPSAKQAKRILEIRDKISLEGYNCE